VLDKRPDDPPFQGVFSDQTISNLTGRVHYIGELVSQGRAVLHKRYNISFPELDRFETQLAPFDIKLGYDTTRWIRDRIDIRGIQRFPWALQARVPEGAMEPVLEVLRSQLPQLAVRRQDPLARPPVRRSFATSRVAALT
jgi:hypothetical protein